MTLYSFKIRNPDGTINEDIIGRIHTDTSIGPVLGNVMRIKDKKVFVTQIIPDGSGFLIIVDFFNPNAPYRNT